MAQTFNYEGLVRRGKINKKKRSKRPLSYAQAKHNERIGTKGFVSKQK
jgi:hypothetical protein